MGDIVWWWLDKKTLSSAFEPRIEQDSVDDNGRYGEGTQAEQTKAERKGRAKDHRGPIDKETAHDQDRAPRRLTGHNPAHAEKAAPRENKLCNQGWFRFGGRGCVLGVRRKRCSCWTSLEIG